MQTSAHEKGQILILFVIGLVGLLGLTALAIDGSMVYSDRRFDQSVADSAALAGATAASDIVNGLSNQLFSCSDPDVINAMNLAIYAAADRAAANGFSGPNALALQNLSTQHGVYVTCVDGTNPRHLEVKVQLSSETSTSFVHLVFGSNQIRNTVDSIVRIFPQQPVAAGFAIVGLEGTCDAVEYDGNIANIVNDGGVFSNGGITKNGASGHLEAEVFATVKGSCGNVDLNGDGSVTDGINVAGGFAPIGTVVTNQPPFKPKFNEIDCNTVPAASYNPTTKTYSAGRHAGFTLNNGEVINLAPGLHCLTSGIRATARGELYGYGVTLYFASGSFDGNGQGKIDLTAPSTAGPDILSGKQGMLIFMDPDNPDGDVDMQGTSEANYHGTVYAPKGNIDFGGDNATGTVPEYKTQFIGWTVKMHGNPAVTVNYDESAFARDPATLDQYE
ncbi:MAG TPA: Tad domain-containing protein [Anaerolineaceae bacterium]|nr:Tad domain-containing protein [Anaerolineaceae bacterium]